jgi:glycosyltransferase involved in cell wall biosynthesis
MTAKPERAGVSIIVATFDAGRTLGRLIESIRGQDYRDWELLVADGGSTDDTKHIIESNADCIAYWHSHADAGIYDAWNQALPRARGRYVCFLGADDAWASPRSLSTLMAAAGAEPYDLVSSQGLVSTGSGEATRFGSAWDYERLGRRMVVCHPGLLHRRGLFDEFGLFDIRYRIAGDLDFLLRLPPTLRTLHVPVDTVLIEGAGVSRRNVLKRLREQRDILSRSPRHGRLKAWLAWLDKMWRFPIARLFGIPH